jgi:hypothetical protein
MSGPAIEVVMDGWEDEGDETLFAKWVQLHINAYKPLRDAHDVVIDFLRETHFPYAIIGGKAAAYHIAKLPALATNENITSQYILATSTSDCDVVVAHGHSKAFLEMLQKKLREEALQTLDEKRFAGADVEIVLMGVRNKTIMNSIIDVHVYAKRGSPNRERGQDGLWYADRTWICKELEYSLAHHTSNDDITKTLKRKARIALLQRASG